MRGLGWVGSSNPAVSVGWVGLGLKSGGLGWVLKNGPMSMSAVLH